MFIIHYFIGAVGMQIFKKLLIISLTFIMSGLGFSCLAYEDNELPPVEIVNSKNLASDAQLSREKQLPILVLFSMEGCSYCRFVEEEYLKPMLRNASYGNKVIIRRVMTDDYGRVVDFDGNQISSLDLSTRYKAYITPTIVFLNYQGKEMAPRILGVSNTEMYGFELDAGIDISLERIRQQLVAAIQ